MSVLDDSVNEELMGLFLLIKDSPRHITIKAEYLIKEVNHIYSKLCKDKHPEKHLECYAHEIKSDLGWHYSVDLVMSMVYGMIKMKGKKGKKFDLVLSAIELEYYSNCYWSSFCNVKPVVVKKPVQQIIYQVQHADIHVESPGNYIAHQITTRE